MAGGNSKHVLVIILGFCIYGALSNPKPGPNPMEMADLFLDGSYFRGIPDVSGTQGSDLGNYFDAGTSLAAGVDISLLQPRAAQDEPDDIAVLPPPTSGWPGRVSSIPLQNSGKDVVTAYAENLKSQMEQTIAAMTEPVPESIQETFDTCMVPCMMTPTLSKIAQCTLLCMSATQENIRDTGGVLYYGLKTLCHSTDTLYTKLEKYNIKSWQEFKTLLDKIKSPQPIGENVPLRAMLVKLIKEVMSPISPYEALISEFESALKRKEDTLSLFGRVIIGAHPACAMISMKQGIETLFQLLNNDPSLADHLLFQGYGVFTSVTKYLGDFPTKKQFAVVNHGLDMLLGTTCGLYAYGENGLLSDCDQYGGYPVLDMPIPDFMWTDGIHAECEKVRAKLLESKQEAGASSTASGGQEKRRRKRSLVVGRKKKAL